VNLTTLDVASNRIKVVENMSHLVKLEEFWVFLCFLVFYLPLKFATINTSKFLISKKLHYI